MKNVKTFFNKFAKQYEAQSRYKYLFSRWTVDNVIKQINRKKCVIMDLGTGNGEIAIRVALKFPKSNIVGIDVSPGMINEAKKKVRRIGLKNVKFIVSPMENLKIKRADFVVSNAAFHHVNDKEVVLQKIYQTLPDKGRVIIGDWFKPNKKYEKEIEKLRMKNPTLAKKFDQSWQDFISEPNVKEYHKKHPKEYPISQIKLKNIMKRVGFRKQKIIKMPMARFAVVVGEK